MDVPVDACAVAHGDAPADGEARTLVVVFANPVARFLLHFAHDIGFRTVLVEPDAQRAAEATHADEVRTDIAGDPDADVVVADHHRPELGPMLRDTLAAPSRWIGVIGSPRHPAPHVPALRDLGVAEADIARVHRPIGLNIGSRTPGEIALATLAGLIADRNGRPGGFDF
jgi:xanthine/CO dehydrogenase XdhC/CoxF family maturation factor